MSEIYTFRVPDNCTFELRTRTTISGRLVELAEKSWSGNQPVNFTCQDNKTYIFYLRQYDGVNPLLASEIAYHRAEFRTSDIWRGWTFVAVDKTLTSYNEYMRQGFLNFPIEAVLFEGCGNLKIIKNLPSTVCRFNATLIRSGVEVQIPSFKDSNYLEDVDLSNLIGMNIVMEETFKDKHLLKYLKFPPGVVNINRCCYNCFYLLRVPEIPVGVKEMDQAFFSCSNLKNNVIIAASPVSYSEAFYDAGGGNRNLTFIGTDSTLLQRLAATSEKTIYTTSDIISPEFSLEEWGFKPDINASVLAFMRAVYGENYREFSQTFNNSSLDSSFDQIVLNIQDQTTVEHPTRINLNIKLKNSGTGNTREIYNNGWNIVNTGIVWEDVGDFSTTEFKKFILSTMLPSVDVSQSESSVSWVIKDGKLTIGDDSEVIEPDYTGSVYIQSRYTQLNCPWRNYRDIITSVDIKCNPSIIDCWFWGCSNLESISGIPESVLSMKGTFKSCSSLNMEDDVYIYNFLYDATGAFEGCTNLSTTFYFRNYIEAYDGVFSLTEREIFVDSSWPELRNLVKKLKNVVYIDGKYAGYVYETQGGLIIVKFRTIDKTLDSYSLPEGATINGLAITSLERTFYECSNLTYAPNLDDFTAVTNINKIFYGCSSLQGNVNMPFNTLDSYVDAFKNTVEDIYLTPRTDNSNASIISLISQGYTNVTYDYYPEISIQSANRLGIDTTTQTSGVLVVFKVNYNQTPSNKLWWPVVLYGEEETRQQFKWFFDADLTREYSEEEGYMGYDGASPLVLYGVNYNAGYPLDEDLSFKITIGDNYLEPDLISFHLDPYIAIVDFDAVTGKELAIGCMAEMNLTDRPIGLFRCGMDMVFFLHNDVIITDNGSSLSVTKEGTIETDDYTLAKSIVDNFSYSKAKLLLGL